MEAALERRTIEWLAALAERSAAHAALEARQQAAGRAATERDALYQQRVADLTQQLQKSNDQLLQAIHLEISDESIPQHLRSAIKVVLITVAKDNALLSKAASPSCMKA